MAFFDALFEEARIAGASLADYLGGTGLRLGVTGLSRAGKTVFITALIHQLTKGGRLPVFRVHAEGRLTGAALEPQPDDQVPRFAYEQHLAALTGEDRHWPQSTRRISELRLTLEFERAAGWRRGPAALTLDIVDYPGEWLLDLPLLGKSYTQWSRETLDASGGAARAPMAAEWRGFLAGLAPDAPASEDDARKAAELFTLYLRQARDERLALSTLPPGRFLMPGDLEGSPLLSFAPLSVTPDQQFTSGTLGALMERRFNSYVSHVVKPFFYGHFARLNRQIVLVDVMSALNAGEAAVNDLRTALTDVMSAFRLGANTLATNLFGRRIDKVLFAATKADLLNQNGHERLEAILRLLVQQATAKAEFTGAKVDAMALSAIRATREAIVTQKSQDFACIAGIPEVGEVIGNEIFDGEKEAEIFPGDLPEDPAAALKGLGEQALHFVKFRPPLLKAETFPHIRLDRAIEFLIGDSLP